MSKQLLLAAVRYARWFSPYCEYTSIGHPPSRTLGRRRDPPEVARNNKKRACPDLDCRLLWTLTATGTAANELPFAMSSEELLRQYQGQIVPQSYNAGFVALSYVVSFVGAASTLELINRRTGFRGLFNHLLLVSSAVTMGGISIWCMHFIGNRAIDLANGETELQVAYSGGFTAVSFFVPILVLLAAFIAIGSNNAVSWWRVTVGGVLCGAAVCGMHYLGNASIANYRCVYNSAYVAGAAIIAVVASIVALAIFFVFRATWASSWWKRAVSAVILAGAVSGMHWCAAVGTRYRLVDIKPKGNEPTRSATVIVVICLSLGACFIIAGSVILRARNVRRSGLRAQQITLGNAIFDKAGRLLVDPDGYIPSTVVTDSFLEKNTKEGFSIAHPLFHWMFQASRNWSGISSLVGGMRQHLAQLPHSGREDGRRGIQLMNENGEMILGYDVIFRELFCLAAVALGDRLREHLTSTGILWDEILPTGSTVRRLPAQLQKQHRGSPPSSSAGVAADHTGIDLEEKGVQMVQQEVYGRGSLMILVRRVETDRDAERLVSAGYRFAELHQVSEIVRASMQIQSPDFESKLRDMARYADKQNRVPPGVHLGFFAIRARVNGGFEVLVRKGARNLLPSQALPMKNLERWHKEYLDRLDGLSVSRVLQKLSDQGISGGPAQETAFAVQLGSAIRALRKWMQEPMFEEAILTKTVVRLPCRDQDRQLEASMITLRLVMPIHSVPSSANCELVPLPFFKMHQISDQYQQAFTGGVHREFGPMGKSRGTVLEEKASQLSSKLWQLGRSDRSGGTKTNGKLGVTGRGLSRADSGRSSSTINLYQPNTNRGSDSIDAREEPGDYPLQEDTQQAPPPSYGGIMVFQEISVDVEDDQDGPGRLGSQDTAIADTRSISRKPPSASGAASGIEMHSMGHVGSNVQVGSRAANRVETHAGEPHPMPSFVDVLFSECVESR
ncbi:hypothetical protein G7046_g9049 [Stylonectria norvegica]|nr:hypothetical protein G7046_g9049 [Stylonectria norvegica]